MSDSIEFYVDDKLIAHVESSFVMEADSAISIRKVSYRILSVTYALDDADGPFPRMRCNVDLARIKKIT